MTVAPSHPPAPGERVGDVQLGPLIRTSAETRVHRAFTDDGTIVAFKLSRGSEGRSRLDHEQRLLGRLPPGPWPMVTESGVVNGWTYVSLSWVGGADLRRVAAELRLEQDRQGLARLCAAIAYAYAALHATGVVHGAIHPRHVRIDGDGRVGLLDFAAAANPSSSDPAEASGDGPIFSALSPAEHAAAVERGRPFRGTAAAEQHAVAALLYLLITGDHHAELPVRRAALARAIPEARVIPFTDHGVPAWPAMEETIERALAHDPHDRHAGMDAFADALAAVSDGTPTRQLSGIWHRGAALTRILDDFIRDARASLPSPSLPPPTCSVNVGAAGVAFALHRLSTVTGDGELLGAAEAWLAWAERGQSDASAFEGAGSSEVGAVTPYHTVSGLAAIRAFVSHARGDADAQHAAIDRFVASVRSRCDNLDLTLGRSAVLLFTALLRPTADPRRAETRRLEGHGDVLCREICAELEHARVSYNGIAHGWAGIAYAILSWTVVRGLDPPPAVADVLDRLVAAAEPYGRGRSWPPSPASRAVGGYHAGWCHGHAGYVFLWNLAYAIYGDAAFAGLAERAARVTVDCMGSVKHATSLCCGSAGGIYAVLNQHRASGEDAWLARARRLAEHAARRPALAGDASTRLGLYKGHAGLALLAAELYCPERAAMPLFELEAPVRP